MSFFNTLLSVFLLFLPFSTTTQFAVIEGEGKVSFTSDAPLEVIKAESDKLKGTIDTDKRSFAFAIPIKSFEGFNSSLQKTHFNENYMESDEHKYGTFKGRIIERHDLTQDGTYTIRAKGKLDIHGVVQERIIRSKIVVKGGEMQVTSRFTVPLQDHNIDIPRIVFQKIATEIEVEIKAAFKAKSDS
jgi:hypothetical protein